MVQSNVIKFIHKKKIKIQGIVIEKPVAENYKKTKECINLLKKNKIPFVINFIFTQMLIYQKLKKVFKKDNFNEVVYSWFFKQGYFENFNKTWKINKKMGGGLLKFYGIHIFYHLIDLFGLKQNTKLTIQNINYYNKFLTYLSFSFKLKKIKFLINISNNSDKKIHLINLKNKKKNIKFINTSQNWTKNFKMVEKKKC